MSNDTGRPITAWRHVPDVPERVYAFLAHLDNHWYLGHPQLRLQAVDGDRRGGRIIVSGPLGVRRTARTLVTTAERPVRFGGIATTRRTNAQVVWSIEAAGEGSRVTLESTVLRLGAVDRVLLSLGGRWWLRRAFAQVLDRLATALDT